MTTLTTNSSDHGSTTVLYANSHDNSQHVEIHINSGFSDAVTATTTKADDSSRRSSSNETTKRNINFSTTGFNSTNNRSSTNSWRDSYNVNNSNNNRHSSTSSTKTAISSSKKDLKKLRKPSDRIQSKSLCATFFYNIPRSSFMITIPGFIILVTGAILTATTDRDVSWVDGGVLLVALVFLILGGVWTLAGLTYWFLTWCRYKPDKLKKSQFRQPTTPVPSYTTSTSAAPNDSNLSRPMSGTSASTATPPSSGSSTFDALNSPFVLQPHPIFSQQQLQLSQQLKTQQNPVDQPVVQQLKQQETNLQQDLKRIQQIPEQEFQHLQQNAQQSSKTIEEEIQRNITNGHQMF